MQLPIFRFLAVFFVSLSPCLLISLSRAQADPPSGKEFAEVTRGLILANMPTPLTEKEFGWGRQVESVVGHKMKNHGTWRKLRVSAMSPAKTLTVDIRNLKQLDGGQTAFELAVGFDAQIDFEQQIWERGLRLYGGSSQARAKVLVTLQCEVHTRSEAGTGPLPDFVFKLRVTKADLRYSGLDFVHVGAIGGDGADVIGHAIHDTIKAVKPTLEKDLLGRADAAIVKASDNKEVRLSLNKLLKLK
ncbi:MAG: hypothetical protein ACJ8F7_14020 [Gemmataceae bacterium]